MQVRLSASNLACRRGDRLLFRGLSFDLDAGEALHVTGANGVGKSTLIRALAGLKSAFAGEVLREGEIGLLDEKPALDPDLSLGRALRFWERLDGCSDASEALTVLGLEPLLDVPVRYLSTGQRKRAGLTALLNRKVPIWLLDEPLSGLDTSAIEQVTALIAKHMGNGGVALIASHQALQIKGLRSLSLEDFVPADELSEDGLA